VIVKANEGVNSPVGEGSFRGLSAGTPDLVEWLSGLMVRCNKDLVCLSEMCVDPSDIPGATGGAVVGTGGAGGATSTVCSAGSVRCACYPNNTCNDSLSCLSQICVELPGGGGATGYGGMPSFGGIVPSYGGVPNFGGIIPAGGGATSMGGSSGSTVPTQVCTDATHCYLGLDDNGGLPGAGNTYGIDGGFYAIGDGCATIHWDAATRCASGTLCAKDPPYYMNWGMEIGLALNSNGGYDYGYDATANGVSGFFWEVNGTAPGMAVRIPLTANSSPCLQTSNACTMMEGASVPLPAPGASVLASWRPHRF
jgi:hypothetical protein